MVLGHSGVGSCLDHGALVRVVTHHGRLAFFCIEIFFGSSGHRFVNGEARSTEVCRCIWLQWQFILTAAIVFNERIDTFVDAEATFAVDPINLQLSELHIDPFHYLFKIVFVGTHQFHRLLFIHPLSHKVFRLLVVREQDKEDVSLVARNLSQVNAAADVVEVAIQDTSFGRDAEVVPPNLHAGRSFPGNYVREEAVFVDLVSLCRCH